ncbi:hypothetical protein AVEN_239859-1 [Araneus ventricosus]|uniref:Uncharacterized protein n=1 Tax=Araneus ventricosus TaxID=182803 RepID=A0A4Y2F8C8_ARAVE|nr:hypothetical protein AVEN_239859-1 [Araneus ventricosus]
MREEISTTEADTSDPNPPAKQMAVSTLTEVCGLNEKGLQILETIVSNEKHILAIMEGIKKLLACYEEILREEKKSLSYQPSLLHLMKQTTLKYLCFL